MTQNEVSFFAFFGCGFAALCSFAAEYFCLFRLFGVIRG